MLETERIADELERGASGGAWHGPSILENLNGVTAVAARAYPVQGAHSIWEIVLHMTSWAREVERRLWEDVRPLDAQSDWPAPKGQDEAAWNASKGELEEAHRRLRQAIREYPPARLVEPVSGAEGTGWGTSRYVMLHGLAQHDAYHTGQIAMLKKALAGERASPAGRTAAAKAD